MLHRNGYALSTIRRHPFRKWFLQAKPQRDLNPGHAADIPRFTIIKIKCGASSAQIQSQSTFLSVAPHFTVLDILPSIFRSASRRDRLENMGNGGRRDGGLKIDRAKPPPRAWPMCIGCRLDLWRGSEGAASGQCRGLSGWFAAGRMAYHCVGGQHLSLG